MNLNALTARSLRPIKRLMHSEQAVGIFEKFLVLTQGVTSGYANEQTGIVEF